MGEGLQRAFAATKATRERTSKLHDYQAARELERIMKLHAFNVQGYEVREKLNQHATLYYFPDNSRLCIYSTRGRGDAWHMDWKGTKDDTHLSPLKGLPVKVNSQGV